jgi:signal transduction histidine kinase/CHASE1-domain containing sensor protein
MRALIGKKRLFSQKKPVWWTGLLLSLAVGTLFYLATAKSIESDARERFDSLARYAQYTINGRIKSYTDVLRGGASLFQASDGLSRAQFHRYVTGLALPQYFPAIETVNFARHIDDSERDAFEAAMRQDFATARDGYPRIAIKPPGRRQSYSVLTYVEPIETWARAVGMDIEARAQVAAALAESRDTGALSTSGYPVPAMSGSNNVGLGMRLPIYRSSMPIDSVAERRAAYIGSVGIAFSVHKLVQGVLDQMPVHNVRLSLFNRRASGNGLAPEDTSDQLLFDSLATDAMPSPALDLDNSDRFHVLVPVDFNGREWKAYFSMRKRDLYTGFDAYFPWLAMLAGFVSTMLIYALFQTLSSSRLRAIKMAKAMTKELRDSQAKLQLSHQKLRRLAAHADQIKEGERKRIAREIHDDLGQNLLALRIEADMLASRTRVRHPRLHERARSTLSQIDATIKSVRQIINDLRPNVLDLGLNAAVDWQIAEFERRTGILCELVENHKDIRLDDHCATAFFRILQESLSNISRHAGASVVKVELKMGADQLSMTVSDNGVGLVAGGRNKVGSFGLVGIEERINILGGHFSITSSPGAGTTVCVCVPVQHNTDTSEMDDARFALA